MGCFFDLLDKARVNSWIIYKESMSSTCSRRDFLISLGEELCTTQMESRDTNAKQENTKYERSKTRVACCAPSCFNKTNSSCNDCRKMFCGKHSEKVTKCYKCHQDF